MFARIERLKSEWTDRYVVVDGSVPELARFAAATGLVKTVNMNGRCLVEFDQFNNVAWYDIDPSCLRIVPKPEPKPAVEKAAKPAAPRAAAPKAAAPAEKAEKPAVAKPAGNRPSTADILAAARAKGTGPAPASPSTGKPVPASAAKEKLSTAEILAKARGGKASAAPTAPAADDVPQTVAREDAGDDAAPPEPPAPAPKTARPAAASGPKPTTTAEKIAWCREHDAR